MTDLDLAQHRRRYDRHVLRVVAHELRQRGMTERDIADALQLTEARCASCSNQRAQEVSGEAPG
jgi:hypothetical protein